MPAIDLSILNQRQTPAFYADVFANRPAAGFVGRIFVSTNTFAFYRDNGTGWDLIGGPGTGTVTGAGASGQIALWSGASTIVGDTGLTYDGTANSLTASKFIVTGGTSSQFLKGDGSLDSNTYNTGSGAASQVAFFSGTNAITGENNLWWDSVNNHFGINTNTPGTAADIHHDQSTLLQLNQTTATNDTRIAFQNAGSSKWRIGNFYSAGSNDYKVNDAVLNINRFTIKSSSGQTFVGDETTSSGLFVVNNSSGDAHIVALGASAPSIRVRNAGVGASLQFGLGLATTTNNFIQGSTGGEFCIFNDSLTAQPILFGIKDAGLGNTQEAARITAARNFLIGTTTDNGNKLQVNGVAYFNSNVGIGVTPNAWSGYNAIQFGNNFSISPLGTSKNAYFNGSDYIYISNNYASLFQQVSDGSYAFYNAASGTAGNTISFTQAMTLTNNGNLGVGVVPTTRLHIKGIGTTYAQIEGTAGNTTGLITNNGSKLYFTGTYYNVVDAWEVADLSSGGTTRMAISGSTGNLLIGTTTDAGQKLQVNGTTALKGGNGDQLSLNNSGERFTQISFQNNTNAKANIWWDNTNTELVLLANSSGIGTLKLKNSGVLNIPNIPTSAAGLVSGDIYSNAGILTIVP